MAIGTAPGWLANLKDETLRAQVERLKMYLRTETPKQDYDRTLLLWAAARLPDLVDTPRRKELVEMVLSKQRPDGGWSIRTFGAPEQWGSGNRAEKLKSEPEFADPPSDGHQTGLAIVVLRESGVPAADPRIQKGIEWLKSNQRASGRWWTRSLNSEKWHFITYSGTALPLLALAHCDALPPIEVKTSAR
jgi:squalene-hopene/tetraprenyl-beta-curcumene cyclase